MSRRLNIIKDHTNEQLVFHKQQDCSGIVKANHEDRASGPKDLSFGRKIASVPLDVLDAWKREGIDYTMIQHDIEQRRRFYAKLNEYKKFLTYDGGIGQ